MVVSLDGKDAAMPMSPELGYRLRYPASSRACGRGKAESIKWLIYSMRNCV